MASAGTVGLQTVGLSVNTDALANSVAQRDGAGGLTCNQVSVSAIANTGTEQRSFAAVTTSETIGLTRCYFCDATGGDITLTLPAVATVSGQVFTLKKIDSGGNAVTFASSANIDGASTKATNTQWAVITVMSNGSTYFTI